MAVCFDDPRSCPPRHPTSGCLCCPECSSKRRITDPKPAEQAVQGLLLPRSGHPWLWHVALHRVGFAVRTVPSVALSAWLNPQALTYFLIDHDPLASFDCDGKAVADWLIQGPTLLAAVHPKSNMTIVNKGDGPFPGVSDMKKRAARDRDMRRL